MSAKDYNLERMRQVRDQIKNHPESHNQGLWARFSSVIWRKGKKTTNENGSGYLEVKCPTSACVAGWTVHYAGAAMLVPDYRKAADLNHALEAIDCVTRKGEVRTICGYAREELGIDEGTSSGLFDGHLSRHQVLRRLGDLIKEGEKAQKAEKIERPEPKKVKVEHVKAKAATPERTQEYA